MLKLTFTVSKLLIIAMVTLVIDLLFFALTKTCANCSSFSTYLSSSHALFAPVWASILGIFTFKRGK